MDAGDAGYNEGDEKRQRAKECGRGRHRAGHCTMVRWTAGCATVPPIEVLAFSRAAYGRDKKGNKNKHKKGAPARMTCIGRAVSAPEECSRVNLFYRVALARLG
jgi:hypothetical protein